LLLYFSNNERAPKNFRHYQKFNTTGTCVMNLDPVKMYFGRLSRA
jgi:hypothetical protein